MAMHTAYLISVWLHIMTAVVWVGGTMFFAFVLVPAIRQPEFAGVASGLIRWTGLRFRWVGWVCFAIFIATGSANLGLRGIGLEQLQSAQFWQDSFGRVLAVKLILVAAILAISAWHDFFAGPRATAAWQADPKSAQTLQFRRQAVKLGRLNLLLALVVIVLAVMLGRGTPW